MRAPLHAAAVCWMVGGLGCAPTAPLDVGLAGHGEELGAHFGHRLSQMHPYVWAEGGVLWLLACRWPTGAEIGVGLAGDGRAEAHALAEARGAWAQEALGVSLVPAPAEAAEIRVEVTDAVAAADGSAGAGRTTADCALAPGDPPAARLVRASVQVAREAPPEDVADGEARDPRVLSDAERIGVFVHELGHALGFQGHAVTGTVMARGRRGARETGARVQRGRPLEDSTLSALYALPLGAVLARAEIPPIRTADLDRLGALARARRWAGPTLRVGDRSARIFWMDGAGAEVGFALVNLEETLRQPDRALFVAEEAARRLLDAAESEPTAPGG